MGGKLATLRQKDTIVLSLPLRRNYESCFVLPRTICHGAVRAGIGYGGHTGAGNPRAAFHWVGRSEPRRLAPESAQVAIGREARLRLPLSQARMIGNRFGAPLASALVLYLVFASLTARRGHIWSNEAWFASPALTLLHEGYLVTTILESKGTWMEGIDRLTYWIPPLHLLLQAAWYHVFGFGLISMRSLSMAAGLTLLLAWYWIVARLTASRGIALLAVVIAATDTRVLTFTALGRPDSLCAAFGVLGWMAYLRWRDISLPRAILAGNSLAAASCLTHPCGELYAAGLLALTLYYDRGRLGWRNLAGIGLPYVVAVAAWGAYILQAPSQFVTQLLGNVPGVGAEFTGVRRLAGLTSPLAALKREYFLRYGY